VPDGSHPKTRVEIVETSLGAVEVARVGDGAPVVFVHGTPGGWDSSVAMGRFLVDAGFELIAPSRPGYLRTALEDRVGIDDQADLLAAVLDSLGHERATVVTWSGGGPSGYRLAVRHPDRVSALVAFAAVSRAYRQPKEDLETRLMLKTKPGNWLLRFLAAHAAKATVSATLEAEGDLSTDELKRLVAEVLGDERQLDVVLTMANVVGDYAHRKVGIENDWDRFAEIDSLGLERIQAPTLVINGSSDTDVPPDHSEYAAATIPGAERLVMAAGTHLSLFAHPDAGAAQARVVELLR
jgi:pimeloyl-ACP methyl ester carboxylesterase